MGGLALAPFRPNAYCLPSPAKHGADPCSPAQPAVLHTAPARLICVNSILCLFSIYHQYVCAVIFCKTSHRDEQALQAPCRTNIHHLKSASSHQIASKQKQSRVYTHHIRACHSAMHDSCKSRYTSLNTKGKLGEEERGEGGGRGQGGGYLPQEVPSFFCCTPNVCTQLPPLISAQPANQQQQRSVLK